MRLRTALGAVLTVIGTTAGSGLVTAPAALADPDPGLSKTTIAPADLHKIDIIGACKRLGIGILYVRLICSDAKKSECSTRISAERAAAAVATREEARLNIKLTTLPYSVTADNVNSAAFRNCDTGAPVPVKKIELSNNFTVSGVQLKECTVGISAGTEDNAATILGSLNCTIETREDTFRDESPAVCVDSAQCNSDVYQWYARWATGGVITRYMHEAQGRFTGYSGSAIRVSTVVDWGI